eukprot:scaffold1327_cov124-Cylindrotheca_fusiformis.AAC.5
MVVRLGEASGPNWQKRQTVAALGVGIAILTFSIYMRFFGKQYVMSPYDTTGARQVFDQPQILKILGDKPALKRQLLNLSTLHYRNSSLTEYEELHSEQSDFSVDVLIVGSLQQTELPTTQLETWASHKSVRHFVLATELDTPNPNCLHEMNNNSIFEEVNWCKARHTPRYLSLGPENELSKLWTNSYARFEWLQKKKNPAGWLCAQPRFPYAMVKMLDFYREHRNFPDYLVLADDDLYLDMEVFTNEYLVSPNRAYHHQKKKESKQPYTTELEDMLIPPPSIPTVWAGCRVRPPIHLINFTFPFGGYGTYFSTAALKRMVKPLYCHSNHTTIRGSTAAARNTSNTLFQNEACQRLKPGMVNIGEAKYYKPGMSVRDLILEFLTKEERFCAHSDWFLAYFVNYYNISRHTITQKLYPGKPWRFDDFMEHVPEARLHTIAFQEPDDSEVYRSPLGNCAYDGTIECDVRAKICHYVNTTVMKRLFAAKTNLLASSP